ncbi:HGGxSTG domain-containing protein [Klebsiella michiganensis]
MNCCPGISLSPPRNNQYGLRLTLTPFPEACRDMTCGATTRKGTPCKMTALYASGRCKLHGGMSTGAKTPEGKARQLEGFRRWLERKRQTTSQGDGSH